MNLSDYIYAITHKWAKLKQMQPLTQEQIKEIDDDTVKMYLFCYYGFDEIYNYNEVELKRVINSYNNNLYLLLSFSGHLEIMKYLEGKGFDIHSSKNYHGINAYLSAATGGQLEIMKYLEEKGVDINSKNCYGENAYLLASFSGQIEVMKYLEGKCVDINNSKNIYGSNAYLLAVHGGHIEVMKYLEEKGADISAKNNYGQSAHDLALYNKHHHVIAHLQKAKQKAKYNHLIHSNETGEECLLCYGADTEKYIKCKNNHFIHLDCLLKTGKDCCIYCFIKY